MTGPPTVTGPAVILSGRWLAIARQALIAAQIARRRNGLPESRDYAHLICALTSTASRERQPDPPDMPPSEPMTSEQAARILGISKRQTQRIATQLGGRLIGGRWLLDPAAVQQHLEGMNHE